MAIEFECKKCGHRVYTEDIIKLSKTECPICGEEGYLNWILFREYKEKTNK